jgi:hypothetical protein
MSVELAFINQLLTKPNSAEKVTLTAGSTITKGSEITINNDGEAELNAYNIIPDNTISSSFLDFTYPFTQSSSYQTPFGTNPAFKRIGTDKYAFMVQEYDSSTAYYNIYLYVLKVDTSTETLSVAGSVLVRTAQYSGQTFQYGSLMVTPEEDYILLTISGRHAITGGTNYGAELWRITLGSSGTVSSPTKIYDMTGSSSIYRYLWIGDQNYYAAGTTLGDRYVYCRSYYSTSFNSVVRVELDGGSSVISSDLQSTVGSGWFNIDVQSRQHGVQLHYIAGTNVLGYQRYLPSWTSSTYWGQLSITPDANASAVPFSDGNCVYVDEEPDSNNIVRYVMWDGFKGLTTYQIQVDPSGSTAPSVSGQYTSYHSDANIFLYNNRSISSPRYGNRFAKSGDDVYFTNINNILTSGSTDSPTDYQGNLMKLAYTSTNGGYYTLSHQGLVDGRFPATTASLSPTMHIDSNGTYVISLASDWDTTDGINDHKWGLFKVSTTGLSDATYAHRVKCVALEDASAGSTFQALSYAPVVSDSTLVAGTNYDRHIATSNGLLIEKA